MVAGCQSGKTTKFITPKAHKVELTQLITELGSKYKLQDKLAESNIPEAFVYYINGEAGSWLMIGAREYEGVYVVDVSIYEAGIYDKEKYLSLETEAKKQLEALYGESLKVVYE